MVRASVQQSLVFAAILTGIVLIVSCDDPSPAVQGVNAKIPPHKITDMDLSTAKISIIAMNDPAIRDHTEHCRETWGYQVGAKLAHPETPVPIFQCHCK